MNEILKEGFYNGSICYGGLIYCVQGDISIESLDFILDLLDDYCDIKELLSEENTDGNGL